jgi:hypothetical protein
VQFVPSSLQQVRHIVILPSAPKMVFVVHVAAYAMPATAKRIMEMNVFMVDP